MSSRVGAVLLVVVLAIAAGCGSDEGDNATQDWANDVCTEMNTWVTSIRGTADQLTAKGLGIKQPDVEAAVDDAQSATNDLVSGLKELGAPDDSAVQQAKDELDQLGTEIQKQLDNVKEAAGSNTGAVQLAQAVAAAVSASAAAAKSTFETIESLDASEELKNAFQDADSCKTLRESIDELG